jgi:hypothetical protein
MVLVDARADMRSGVFGRAGHDPARSVGDESS